MNKRYLQWLPSSLLLTILFLTMLILPGCTSMAPVIAGFEITPASIFSGQSATINWNVTGASSVIIDKIGVVSATGSNAVTPGTTTLYTITAENNWGRVSKSAVVTVKSPPLAIDFKANPAALLTGEAVTLSWNVTGAASVSIDQGIGQVLASGNKIINPATTTAYTLIATNADGTSTGTVTVVVNPPISVVFTATPTAVFTAQGTILQWNVTGATKVSIDQGIGDVPPNGSQGVIPYNSTVYTITATSPSSSVSKSVVVTVSQQNYWYYRYPFPYWY